MNHEQQLKQYENAPSKAMCRKRGKVVEIWACWFMIFGSSADGKTTKRRTRRHTKRFEHLVLFVFVPSALNNPKRKGSRRLCALRSIIGGRVWPLKRLALQSAWCGIRDHVSTAATLAVWEVECSENGGYQHHVSLSTLWFLAEVKNEKVKDSEKYYIVAKSYHMSVSATKSLAA